MAQTFNYHGLPVEMESVSNVTLTNSVDLGTLRVFSGEEYVYCYNAANVSASPGQFMVLSANSGYSVTISSVTMYDFPIGFVKHATLPTAAYGWLMTRGFCNVLGPSNVSFALSDVLFPAGQGRVGNLGTLTSLQCAVMQQPIGYVVSAGATVGASTGVVVQAYVRTYGS